MFWKRGIHSEQGHYEKKENICTKPKNTRICVLVVLITVITINKGWVFWISITLTFNVIRWWPLGSLWYNNRPTKTFAASCLCCNNYIFPNATKQNEIQNNIECKTAWQWKNQWSATQMRSECILLQFGIKEGRVELDKRAIVQREPEADPLYRCSDASKREGMGGFTSHDVHLS